MNMFENGKILYDPNGWIGKLKRIAMKIVEEYQPTEAELMKDRMSIQAFMGARLLRLRQDMSIQLAKGPPVLQLVSQINR